MVKELQAVAERNARAATEQADTQRQILALAIQQDAEAERTADAAADLISIVGMMLEDKRGRGLRIAKGGNVRRER